MILTVAGPTSIDIRLLFFHLQRLAPPNHREHLQRILVPVSGCLADFFRCREGDNDEHLLALGA